MLQYFSMPGYMDILLPQLKALEAGVSAALSKEPQNRELQLQVRVALDLWRTIDSVMEQRSFATRNDRGEHRDLFLRDQQKLYSTWAGPAQKVLSAAKEVGREGEFIER